MYLEEDRSQMFSGYTMVLTYSAAEATVDLHCKTVCFNQLFGDMNIFIIVLSKKDNFFKCFTIYILWNSLSRMVLPFLLHVASTGVCVWMCVYGCVLSNQEPKHTASGKCDTAAYFHIHSGVGQFRGTPPPMHKCLPIFLLQADVIILHETEPAECIMLQQKQRSLSVYALSGTIFHL
jgi:hypothetical protein